MRYTQPQSGPIYIDWASPVARGLSFAALPGLGVDLVRGKLSSTKNPLVTKLGIGHSHSSAGTVQAYDNSSSTNLDGTDFTVLVILNLVGNDTGYRGVIGKADATSPSTWVMYTQGGLLRYGVLGAEVPFGAVSVADRNNAMFAVAGTSGGAATGYQDGIAIGSAAAGNPSAGSVNTLRLGVIRNDSPSENLKGTYLFAAIWKRKLSAQEIASIYANPWQLFKSPQRVMLAAVGSGATATPPGVSAATSIGAATIAAGASANPAGVSVSGTVGTYVAQGGAGATPQGIASNASTGTVAVSAGASAVPNGVTAATSLGTVTATGAGAGAAIPAGMTATSAVGTPAASGGASVGQAGVTATAAVGQVIASAGTAGVATPAGVGSTAFMGSASVTGGAQVSVSGVGVTATIGQVIASGSIFVGATATPAGVTAYGWTGMVTATSDEGLQPNPHRTYIGPSRIRLYTGQQRIRQL